MNVFEFDTYEEAFVGLLDMLAVVPEVEVRGVKTRELLHATIRINFPSFRTNLAKHRNGNPFAQIAETLWMLAGRNDLDWLERYIPQCKKWSDDGKTWRAAYGPRLRAWGCASCNDESWNYGTTDQVQQVIDLLKHDPQTRQAVISLWDPANDWPTQSKDIPCNNWLHFIIRDGQLHLNVAVRSNDIMYGFSHVDFYGWSVMQQMIADFVGVTVGHMTWNASSLHLYESHYDKAAKIVDAYKRPHDAVCKVPGFHTLAGLPEFDSIAKELMSTTYEHELYGTLPSDPSWLQVAAYMLRMYNYYLDMEAREPATESPVTFRVKWVNALAAYVSAMPIIDAKYQAIEFFSRRIQGFSGALTVSMPEYQLLQHYGIC